MNRSSDTQLLLISDLNKESRNTIYILDIDDIEPKHLKFFYTTTGVVVNPYFHLVDLCIRYICANHCLTALILIYREIIKFWARKNLLAIDRVLDDNLTPTFNVVISCDHLPMSSTCLMSRSDSSSLSENKILPIPNTIHLRRFTWNY